MEGGIKEEKRHEDKEEDVNVDIQISAPVEKKGVRRARTKQKKQDEATKNMTTREKRRYNTVKQLHESHEVLRDIWDVVEKKGRIEGEMIAQPKDIVMQLLPFQLEGLDWMTKQEQSPVKGGVLADEMGMGKTIQTVSLLSTTRQDGQPTLVIVPTVALIQWKNEIQLYAPSLKVVMYYGTDRNKKSKELESKDVVLTTYAVLESCFRKQNYGVRRRGTMVKEQSMLHTINWHRVILDEAHNIKDRTSNTARASFALKATYRWCLSGTPLQNRVGELYSLIRFLQLKPFSMYFCIKCECKSIKWNFAYNEYHCQVCKHSSHQHVCFWNFEVLKPIQEYGASGLGLDAFRKLNLIIDLIMLRRTKVERAADLGLPPKIVTIRRDRFSPEELDFYTSLFSNSRRSFDTYASHGTVLNNYANIFELITKMRLAVNHPDLLTHKLASSGESSDLLVCSICHCEPEDPIASKCKHVYCRVCVSQYLESYGGSQPSSTTTSTSTSAGTPSCTMCFAVLTIDLTQPPIEYVQAGPLRSLENSLGEDIMITTPDTMVYKRSIVNRINMATWRSSTKIEALVEELQALRRSDCTIKSLVFSQFVNFLDLVQWRLNRAGFSVCRLDGHMSPSQRDAVIRTFMTKPQYTVFLVSLKAGGVALNLTEASHVFICDPWWNPAVEDQAMDRIHRLGQRRPIRTTKLIVENSIESRIVVLQEKKRDLFMSTIGKDTTALSRLSEEDMEYLFTS
ncbi:DNA repair protein RAD16 [Zancudomyces culisetae]|uniref:DNA repair protein RAD16 n=1 Tax=Zancudomyces culisetae TaxID=1213189 RepID=A0A1R1PRQ9_ZANCU|nr:DNA repair protein RAD16 [Zancudomyces culisetae]|eukprot:OMH83638.1 DNA repair protein RAD16 [Zancudomyces culisetae]